MTYKDRVAVVVSLGAVLIMLLYLGDRLSVYVNIWLGLGLFVYWGYRFIKNDISFLRIKDK